MDDNKGLAEILSFTLEDAGHSVRVAGSGAEALAAMSHDAFDVAVLDLQLPDLTGLELFTALRADTPGIEGILITGHASVESAIEAVNQGLYSYVPKPVSPDILRITVERAVERKRFQEERARLLLEREEHLSELQEAYQRERRIAETLQRSFLPSLQVDIPGLQIAHLYQAALAEAEVGGDFYDVVELTAGQIGLVMGDVSGKGLDAAVYTALAKYTLRGYAIEDPNPGRVLQRLNHALSLQSGLETFATLFCGVLDLESGILCYASAGHEPALLFHPETGTVEELPPTGPAAGVIPDADYATVELGFADHESLLLYTDGASDARHDDEWLGTDGLARILSAHAHESVPDALAGIYDSILHFSRHHLRDDTAMLLVRREQGREPAARSAGPNCNCPTPPAGDERQPPRLREPVPEE